MISSISTFGLGNDTMHQRMFPSLNSTCKGLKIVCHLSILFRCFYCLFASNELALSSGRTCNWTTLWVYHGTPEPSTSEWLYIPFGKCHGILIVWPLKQGCPNGKVGFYEVHICTYFDMVTGGPSCLTLVMLKLHQIEMCKIMNTTWGLINWVSK